MAHNGFLNIDVIQWHGYLFWDCYTIVAQGDYAHHKSNFFFISLLSEGKIYIIHCKL